MEKVRNVFWRKYSGRGCGGSGGSSRGDGGTGGRGGAGFFVERFNIPR